MEYSKEYENLGRNVRFLRQKYRLSQKSLAALLGIGVGSLRRIERGEMPPRLSCNFLTRLSGVFAISIDAAFSPERKDP